MKIPSWHSVPQRGLLAVALVAALAAAAGARPHLVRGHVRAADTGEGLPAATLQIAGTYRGTIANDRGEYLLEVSELPATIRVTYIGYASRELVVPDTTVAQLDFLLEVSPYRMPETVVRPEEAVRIMAEVIRRKQEWRPRIERYRADAYSRFVVENATDIVLMGEVVSELYWDQEKGRREVVLSRRMTRNAEEGEAGYFSALQGFVNLYDDDLPFVEHRIIGPTHPDALDHYDFRLVGRRAVDDQLVYDIEVRPKSRLQMAFVGQVAVLDGEYALLEADLTPSRAALASAMPVPLVERFEVSFRQQFRGFEGGVWLPVDYRMRGSLDIGMVGLQLPVVKLDMVTRLTEYEVTNVVLPDSLYAREEKLQVDTLAVEADSAFTRFADPIPLTPREEEAYATIDTSFSMNEAFRPTGFLTRFMDLDEEDDEDHRRREEGRGVQISAGASSEEGVDVEVREVGGGGADTTGLGGAWRRYRPEVDWRLGYSRVSEGYLGAELTKDLPTRVRLHGEAGVHTGLERVTYGGESVYGLGEDKRSSVRIGYWDRLRPRYESATYPMLLSSIQAAVGLDDYFDYYRSELLEVSAEYVGRGPRARIALRQEGVSTLATATDKDMFRRHHTYRPNPATPEGTAREIAVKLSIGGDYVPFGVAANRRGEVRVDHGAGWLGGDYSFTRYQLAMDWHLRTFWRRRWVPNALDVRLVAGTHTGDLPPQRLMAVDVAMGPLTPFGTLRSIHGHPYVGDQYAALFWEHNFKTTPFEFLGLWPLVQRGFGLVVHGASARTWMEDERRQALGYEPRVADDPHHEVGVSLLAYHLFRLDVTRRLDRDDWSVGLGIARFDFE